MVVQLEIKVMSIEFDKRHRILVVDDNQAENDCLKETLRAEGYEIELLSDPTRIQLILESHDLDLIIIEFANPKYSGIRICHGLKKDPRYKIVPIVFLADSLVSSNRLKALKVGAYDIFAKPLDIEEIKLRIRWLMNYNKNWHHLESPEEVLMALARTVNARDDYTGGACGTGNRGIFSVGREVKPSGD